MTLHLHKYVQAKKGLLSKIASKQASEPKAKELRVYLAAPYSHESELVRQERAMRASSLASLYLAKGYLVYSPLSHGVTVCQYVDLPTDFEFWARHCLSFIDNWATELHVLTLDGWQESIGVKAEIERAKELGLPIRYIG